MFSKYQGLGNDFILVDRRNSPPPAIVLSRAAELCDRRRGIGADGVVVLLDGTNDCQYTMRIINADGSEAEMCGNGIRCLALFIQEQEQSKKPSGDAATGTVSYSISTLAGKIVTEILPDGQVSVDMGKPVLYPWSTPWRQSFQPSSSPSGASSSLRANAIASGPFSLHLLHGDHLVTDISMGNPHAVVFVDDLETFLPVAFPDEGPQLSTYHEIFPEGANAGFAQVLSPTHLRLEVWERGSGHTQACGTGACAAAVAGVLGGHVSREEWCRVSLPGGDLAILWAAARDNHVYMRGPGVKVFQGESDLVNSMFSSDA